jgi:hypothetical protein
MEEVRAHFLRIGKLPDIKNGTEVWVQDFAGWTKARIVRRLPGNCYLAKLNVQFMGVSKVVVMTKTFGGLVAK